MSNNEPRYTPTLEEIRDKCQKLQATWTPQEEAAHRGILAYDYQYGQHVWRPPFVALAETIWGARRKGRRLTKR